MMGLFRRNLEKQNHFFLYHSAIESDGLKAALTIALNVAELQITGLVYVNSLVLMCYRFFYSTVTIISMFQTI